MKLLQKILFVAMIGMFGGNASVESMKKSQLIIIPQSSPVKSKQEAEERRIQLLRAKARRMLGT